MKRNIIAILRGVRSNEVVDICAAIIDAGISQVEVPLNSPDPLSSISLLVDAFGETALIGAGTVLTRKQVFDVASTGAKFIVSPNCDPEIIKTTRSLNMMSFPGVLTPTECFTALKNGADGLKIFPAGIIGPNGVSAIRAVLPADTQILAVGGASADNFDVWFKAGIDGFGIGSAIYQPGWSAKKVSIAAHEIVRSFDEAKHNNSHQH